MATVNIGTNKGNITNVKFDKPFNKITHKDILEVATEKLGNVYIIGWAKIYPKRNKKLLTK